MKLEQRRLVARDAVRGEEVAMDLPRQLKPENHTLHFRLLETSAAGNGTTFKLQSLSSCASRRGPDEEIIRPRHMTSGFSI